MPKVELPFEALLEATEQLDTRQLEMLLQRATELKQHQQSERQREEERLMAIWNIPSFSLHDKSHLEELRGRLEDEQISEPERQELLHKNQEAMEAQVRRLQAVVDLAHLRGVDPAALLDQLQPRPS